MAKKRNPSANSTPKTPKPDAASDTSAIDTPAPTDNEKAESVSPPKKASAMPSSKPAAKKPAQTDAKKSGGSSFLLIATAGLVAYAGYLGATKLQSSTLPAVLQQSSALSSPLEPANVTVTTQDTELLTKSPAENAGEDVPTSPSATYDNGGYIVPSENFAVAPSTTDETVADEGFSAGSTGDATLTSTTDTDSVARLQRENAALRAEISTLKAQQSISTQTSALATLRHKAAQGKSFLNELNAAMEGNELSQTYYQALAALQAIASKEIPNQEALIDGFSAAIKGYAAEAHKMLEGEEATVLDKTLNNIKSFVKIRKVGDTHAGDDDASIIARAEAMIKRSELSEAVKELSALTPQAAKYFEAWVTNTKERLTLDKNIEQAFSESEK